MLTGEMVDVFKFEAENAKAEREGKRPAVASRVLLGITKACFRRIPSSRRLPSRRRPASSRMRLSRAKVDPLVGLKEDIIIGKLILPARA